jgi:hypothetical protein
MGLNAILMCQKLVQYADVVVDEVKREVVLHQ